MTRGILIAGIESSLFTAVALEAGKRVEQFAAAAMPNRLAGIERLETRSGGGSRISLNWNPGSPISARSLVLAAQNQLARIDEAILVCIPPSIRGRIEDLAPIHVETVINDHIKSWFFLARELCAAFTARGAGTLTLVLSEPGLEGRSDDAVDLIGPSVAASFRAFAQGVLADASRKNYQALAFSSETGDDAGFAAYIFKIMEEGGRRNAGRWHKFGKTGIFTR